MWSIIFFAVGIILHAVVAFGGSSSRVNLSALAHAFVVLALMLALTTLPGGWR